ncbi:lysophospholipase L1-like esterase [Fontibacillus phaseoli]|uniref:Lysophospholipase L1-like esterase n=1 Tax=Fontibacillus phaseoli TaxID=1416533 RepID=A0A369BF77_9BACL|nr:GDSL-type esterase/lipase family protein [Fontibacillus phaseoli]RCX19137.1 lysophospholipase L1-like esterase [Fontibacillus phaseoli]
MGYLYTAIGDSLTTGAGAWLSGGFAPIYRRMAESRLRTRVDYENLGVNGMTSQKLLAAVQGDSRFRAALRQADIITVSIGANDLRPYARAIAEGSGSRASQIPQALNRTKGNVRQIVYNLYQIKSPQRKPFIIRMVGVYNPFPNIREAGVYARQYNAFLTTLGGPNYRVANIYSAFEGNERELLFLDRVHPNSRGYRVIAQGLDRLGYLPLQ